jgi:hypothetical protein
VTAARLAAQCVELLGPTDGPVAVVTSAELRAALAGRLRVARDDEAPVAAVCAFLGEGAEPATRQRRLAALAARLPVGAPVVVVDHNQPRAWWRRATAVPLLAFRRFAPSRARYPVAGELRDHGFTIERLRFAAGERVQLVVGRRA